MGNRLLTQWTCLIDNFILFNVVFRYLRSMISMILDWVSFLHNLFGIKGVVAVVVVVVVVERIRSCL
jgi:hypothetical protein